jgi:8-oxo-dGTP pyrophosphatase MutT (NUDIX family)
MNKYLDNIDYIYSTTEWEIPKGRKNINEKNINCAIREFKEETSLDSSQYKIINAIDPIHDVFTGTNMKEYRHIFYTSVYNDTNMINYNMINYNNEIDMVSWCGWNELNNLFRPYNINKINILTRIFLFIVNICESYSYTNAII